MSVWRITSNEGELVVSGTMATGPELGDNVWPLTGRLTWGNVAVRDEVFVTLHGSILRVTVQRWTLGTFRGEPRTIEIRGRSQSLGDVVLDVRQDDEAQPEE